MNNFSYSNVATKLKKSRQHFSIKQSEFEKYGISQHYISMIESSARKPSLEMIESIHTALFKLTKGEIETLYPKDDFMMSLEDQVSQWLHKEFNQITSLILYYDECIRVLYRYELYELAYEIHQRLFRHYLEQKNFKIAFKFYTASIADIIKSGKSPGLLYIEFGDMMRQNCQYENALIYYLLALDQVPSENEYTYYKLIYKIGHTYFKLDKLADCIFYTEKIITSCPITEVLAAGKLLQGQILYKQKNYELSRITLNQVINELDYCPYFSYAYYNIALSFHQEENYPEALKMLDQSLKYINCDTEKLATLLFLSIIYFKMQDYTQSILYCEESKKLLSSDVEYCFIKDWYHHALELFNELNDFQQITKLFEEVAKAHYDSLLETLKLDYIRLLTKKYGEKSKEFYQDVCKVVDY